MLKRLIRISLPLKLLVENQARWFCCPKMVLTFLSLWIKSKSVTIQMKATEQYVPVVLFIMLYKVVLPFESVDEILKCEHSNESY